MKSPRWPLLLVPVASLSLLLLSSQGQAFSLFHRASRGVPVLGIDARGQPAQAVMDETEYGHRLSAAVTTYRDSAAAALQQQQAASPGAAWNLRNLIVGIGVDAEVGFGPIRIGAVPAMRLIFSNAKEPDFP
jgi:hypothetical protein